VPLADPWIKLPVALCLDEDCIVGKDSPKACLTVTNPEYSAAELVSTGFRTTFSVLLGIPEIGYEECKYNEVIPLRYLRVSFSLTIPFSTIQGAGSGATAFDTVLLAKSEGKPDGSPLIFSNVGEQAYSQDLLQLLNRSSQFERFSSIRDFETRNGSLQYAPPPSQDSKKAEKAPRAFTQSTVVPLQIGGFSKLAFVQPFASAHFPGQDKLVLIGIVSESAFNKTKYAVPYNWLSNALLLLFLGVLSFNFARLKLIKNKGILRRSDVYVSAFSLAGVASLFVVFLVQLLASWEFNSFFEEDAKNIHSSMSAQFNDELDKKVQTVHDIHFRQPYKKECSDLGVADTADCFTSESEAVPGYSSFGNCGKRNVIFKAGTDGFPEVSTQFVLDESGKQDCYYFTHNRNTVRTGFNVKSRDYFTRIRDGEGWRTSKGSWSDDLQNKWGEVFDGEFYLNRIESKTNGAQQTALSFPLKDTDSVLVALAKFYSLEHVVLPPGHGFAVFDNASGLVLFHSSEARNLRENFYRATDDNQELKSTVVAQSKKKVRLTYKGDLVSAVVSPLKNTHWTLVTFHHDNVIDAFNFHHGTSALMLGGIYGAVFLVALPGLIWFLLWLYRMTVSVRVEERFRDVKLPQWIFPERGKSSAQRSLGIALLQLVFVYVACIYFFDLPEARWWMLIVLVAVPCCWFYFLHMKPDSEEKVPIGKPYSLDNAKSEADRRDKEIVHAFGLYRLNITLSVVLLAVLPTLLLSNENGDIHQKQWLQFSHWFTVEQLKDRNVAYAELNSKFRHTENICSELIYCEQAWRGIYIPGTEVTDVKLGDIGAEVPKSRSSLTLAPISAEPAMKLPQKRDQAGYLDSILSMLPSFGVEGELLEGLDANNALYDEESSTLHLSLTDSTSGMNYLQVSDFPRTRPSSTSGLLRWILFYVGMVFVSAVTIASLAGFLVRRFLSRSFEENLLNLATIPNARDLGSGAIVVRPSDVEPEGAYRILLKTLGLQASDFQAIAGTDTSQAQVVATEQPAKIIVIRDFFSITQDHAVSCEALAVVRKRLREDYRLIMLSDIDPNHWAKSDQVTDEAFEQWEGIINSLATFMLPIEEEGRSLYSRRYVLSPRVYKRVWRRCSEDEQMVLAGLCHEGIVNPRNDSTLQSLYRRRLVNFQNSHFEFGDLNWREYVAENLNREDFRERARRYKNSVWISFRGPLVLILIVLVLFIAYVAQDEMRLLFSILGTVGAGAATLTALGSKLRSMTNQVETAE